MSSSADPSAADVLSPAASVPRRAGAPPRVADYELLRPIGAGAYGEVWLARSATGALRAVKLVHRASFADERPFLREFEGIQKFEELSRSHPSQLAIFHVGRDEAAGCFYYVMELADSVGGSGGSGPGSGEKSSGPSSQTQDPITHPPDPRGYQPRTLRSDLAAGRLPAARVLELALALTEALGHLHASGLVHRDIKPSNIIFVGGRPKLADIGLVTGAAAGDDARSIVGTEGYLPPEGPGMPAADIFAMGRVLYEALTGLDRRKYPELPADLRRWPDARLAFELNAILVKAAAAEARQRYPSAAALLDDLERLRAGRSVRRRRSFARFAKIFAVACGTASAAIVLTVVWRQSLPPRPIPAALQLNWGYGTPTNPFAQQAYTLGRSFTELRTPESLVEGRKHYAESLKLEPGCALTYSGLAANWRNEAHAGSTFGRDAFPRVRELALEALRLAPDLEVGHEKLGIVASAFDYDWIAAERAFRRALTLNPDNIQVHETFIYHVLMPQGRFPEVWTEIQGLGRLAVLDGRFEGARGLIMEAWVAYYAHEFERSRNLYRQLSDLEPNEPEHRRMLARVLEAQGDCPAARALYERELTNAPFFRAKVKAGLIITQIRSGLTHDARAGLEELRSHSDENRAAVSLAWVHTAFGEPESALDWLEKGYERREVDMIWIKVDPRFDALHNHPRFRELLKKMRLE